MSDSSAKKRSNASNNGVSKTVKSSWNTNISSPEKLGQKSLVSAVSDYYKRKHILSAEIYEKKHPEFQFSWVNFPKLQQNSFYHENGWRPFVPTEHSAAQGADQEKMAVKDQYSSEASYGVKGMDNLIHRSEMVLCYMPKEEYEEMKNAEYVARKLRDNTDFFKNKPGLESFQARSTRTAEKIDESEL